MSPPEPSRRKCFGLFTRRERWGLSWRGIFLCVSLLALAGFFWVTGVHSFLAPTQRLQTNILVVEGWVPPYVIRAAIAEFKSGHYEKIYTTGGPVVGNGGYLNDYNTSASVGAELLVKAGMAADLVQMVPSHVSGRDRTYSSAVALREWFHAQNVAVTNFNVVTEDVHARRTQLLFQKAFGRAASVGIIGVTDPDYDPAHWWRYSEGVREILGESIAYLYAKFIFQTPAGAGH